jgi:DNA-binding CsgD family transcriptional regulator
MLSDAPRLSVDWSTHLGRLVAQVSRRWGLTTRQRRVLELVAHGRTNKQLAAMLGISERTAEIHLHNITQRARLQGRSELLAALLRSALECGCHGGLPLE